MERLNGARVPVRPPVPTRARGSRVPRPWVLGGGPLFPSQHHTCDRAPYRAAALRAREWLLRDGCFVKGFASSAPRRVRPRRLAAAAREPRVAERVLAVVVPPPAA